MTVRMLDRVVVGATVTLRSVFTRDGVAVMTPGAFFQLRLMDTDIVVTPEPVVQDGYWTVQVQLNQAGHWAVRVEADGAVDEAVIDVEPSEVLI